MMFWSCSSYLHVASRGSGYSLIIIFVIFTSVMSCSFFRQDRNLQIVGLEQESREWNPWCHPSAILLGQVWAMALCHIAPLVPLNQEAANRRNVAVTIQCVSPYGAYTVGIMLWKKNLLRYRYNHLPTSVLLLRGFAGPHFATSLNEVAGWPVAV
jgi:hypothetical protein